MSTNPENQTQSFMQFNEMLPEVRKMMIDKMQPDVRVRYMRSSRSSREEAMMSKNFIYALEFNDLYDQTQIHVVYHKDKDENNVGYGFILQFKIEDGKKYVIYSNMAQSELWRMELVNYIDLRLFAAEHFKNFLKTYHNMIRKLVIFHIPKFRKCLRNFDYQVESLNRLEILETKFNSNIMQFISKLRRPLQKLAVYGERNNLRLQSYDFTTVQQYIHAHCVELTYEQFLQLPASEVSIHIGDITELEIYNYIELWKSGKTGKEVEHYKWELNGSIFNIRKLLNLLGEEGIDIEETIELEIKHNLEEGKVALLFHEDDLLVFETIETDDKTITPRTSAIEDVTMNSIPDQESEENSGYNTENDPFMDPEDSSADEH